MRWYVHRNGQTAGPVDEDVVAQWVRDGMVTAKVKAEDSSEWHWVRESYSAEFAPPIVKYRFPWVKVATAVALFVPVHFWCVRQRELDPSMGSLTLLPTLVAIASLFLITYPWGKSPKR